MSLPESEPAIEAELSAGLRNVARVLDAASPPIDGPSVRADALSADAGSSSSGVGDVVSLPSRRRRRTLFLSVAAALTLAVGAAVVVGRNGDDRLTVGPATESSSVDTEPDAIVEDATVEDGVDDQTNEVPATTEAPSSTEVDVAESERKPEGSVILPRSVTAAKIRPIEARLLPPADSGLVVTAVSQVLTSEMKVTPEVAEPISVDKVSIPTIDPNDRRSISVVIWTYASAADAEAVLADQPSVNGLASDQAIEVDGRVGVWNEEPGVSAPYSGGDPKHDLGLARVRFGPNVVLDIVGPDLALADAEAIIGGAELDPDGSMLFNVRPDGFGDPAAAPGRTSTWLTTAGDGPPVDYIDMSLVDESGVPLNVVVVAGRSELMDTERAEVESDTGRGWVSSGLFRETEVTWVGPETTISLTDYSGSRTGEELLALVQQFELVGNDEWEQRLAQAAAFHTPVWEK